ncbi:hypothetical protein SBI_03650 [Streptomyces bingchenggensis BCW-1]|uniref:Uncharacterized protein n=1 Tax=Streptomyces bingchenggensis (strain BCW-1) TaxID=749414 RepID=D7CE84_STRBB|nr:hypothetical protein SBI_03650 [Streptomyces bingchenggensis BCW-1]
MRLRALPGERRIPRQFRTTRAPEPAARQRPRSGSRIVPGPGRAAPRRGRLRSSRAAGLAVAVRSAAAPDTPRPVGAGARVGHLSVRFAAWIPVRPVRLIADGFGFPRAEVERLPAEGNLVSTVRLSGKLSGDFTLAAHSASRPPAAPHRRAAWSNASLSTRPSRRRTVVSLR